MQTVQLNRKQLHTLDRIFQHPVSHNLETKDVISLIEHIGTVEPMENGHLEFTIGETALVFHRSQGKDVSEVQQVLDIRHFLEHAGVHKNGTIESAEDIPFSPLHLIVAINMEETLIFRSESIGSVPERIHSYDPNGVIRRDNRFMGRDQTAHEGDSVRYFEEIAAALHPASEILIMGSGTGSSSEMKNLS